MKYRKSYDFPNIETQDWGSSYHGVWVFSFALPFTTHKTTCVAFPTMLSVCIPFYVNLSHPHTDAAYFHRLGVESNELWPREWVSEVWRQTMTSMGYTNNLPHGFPALCVLSMLIPRYSKISGFRGFRRFWWYTWSSQNRAIRRFCSGPARNIAHQPPSNVSRDHRRSELQEKAGLGVA